MEKRVEAGAGAHKSKKMRLSWFGRKKKRRVSMLGTFRQLIFLVTKKSVAEFLTGKKIRQRQLIFLLCKKSVTSTDFFTV